MNFIINLFDLYRKPRASSRLFFKLICLLSFLVCSRLSHGQISNYTFSASAGSFTSIKGAPGSVNPLFTDIDEGYYNNINIPFFFSINGVSFAKLGIDANGFLYFGGSFSSIPTDGYLNNLSTSSSLNSVRPLVAPLWDDITLTSATDINYLSTGTVPNRIFTVEWTNVKWQYSAASAAMSFQVKLYEATNIIEFVYRQESGNVTNAGDGTLGASIGISAVGLGSGNFLSLNNAGASPTASSTTETGSIASKPATGQVYRFTPPASSVPFISSFSPATATTGNTVTIYGANLSGVSAVSFGGTAASSFTGISANTLTAVVGSGSSGNISVTTPGGTVNAAGFTFANPPSISSFLPTSGHFNDTITISGLNFTGATAVSFGGVPALAFIVVNNTTIKAAVNSGVSGPVSVTISNTFSASLPGFTYTGPVITSVSPNNGGTNSAITISGNNFNGVSTVIFGSAPPTSFTIINNNSIIAYTGYGGSGKVVVCSSTGCATASGFVYTPAPAILSFSPAAGPVGTSVTITGGAFIPSLTGNKVTIGGTGAVVTAASTTSLTVTVPPGGSGNQPIVVSAGPYSSYSSKPFIVTSACSAADMLAAFNNQSNLSINNGNGTDRLFSLTAADLDGDGKPDLIGTKSFSIGYFRNRGSIDGNTVFAGIGGFDENDLFDNIIFMTLADMDGNGLSDIITIKQSGRIGVHYNGSTPGNIVFGGEYAVEAFATSSGPVAATVGDLDGNGLPDIAVVMKTTNTVSVYLQYYHPLQGRYKLRSNLVHPTPAFNGNFTVADGSIDLRADSIGNLIMFWQNNPGHPFSNAGTLGYFAAQQPIYAISGTAVDSVTNSFTPSGGVVFSLLTNYPNRYDPASKTIYARWGHTGNTRIYTDTLSYMFGTVSTASRKDFATGTSPSDVVILDIDGDGKQELVVSNTGSNTVSVLRNTGSAGILTFAPKQDFPAGNTPKTIVAGDLDGDGKADIGIANPSSNTISILKNNSIPGSLSLAAPSITATGTFPQKIAIADINADGKPDLASVNKIANTVSILINNSNPGTFSFAKTDINSVVNPVEIALADINVDGKIDIATADSANNTLSIWKNRMNEPIVSSFMPTTANAGDIITIHGKYFTGTTAVTFGEKAAAAFTLVDDTTITATLSAGNSGKVAVYTNCGHGIDSGFTYSGMHSISGFAPESGPVGTIVVISGSNFSSTASENIVYFGAVRANVTAASNSSLTVTVPTGATLWPISVTLNGLTTTSAKPFAVTFACGAPLSVTSFAPQVNFSTQSLGTWKFGIADFDGDGKPDVASGNYQSVPYTSPDINTISIFRNTSTAGNISMAPKQNIFCGQAPDDLIATDLDGDGKPDIAALNTGGYINKLALLRNTGTPGNISFSPVVFNEAIANADYLAYGDFDGDGKPDLMLSYTAFSFYIMKNNSTPGNISFETPVEFPVAFPSDFARSTFASDLDGDGKTDIAFVTINSKIWVMRNTSSNGSLAFAPSISFPVRPGANPLDLFITDLDGNNKPDMVMGDIYDSTITFYRNTSNPGTISFAPRTNFSLGTGNTASKIAAGDMDGDGKTDVVAYMLNSIAVLKNTSVIDSISFLPKQVYPGRAFSIAVVDIDGDGKVDILGGGSSPTGINIIRNQQCVLIPFCPGGSNSLIASLSGTNYQWQVDMGSGFINIVDDANYSGAQSSTLLLNNVPSAWTGYKYRCVVDAVNTNEMNIRFINTWTGVINSAWENPGNWSCGTVPDVNTNVYLPKGPVILNSSTTINTLTVLPGVSFTVTTGNTLTVIH